MATTKRSANKSLSLTEAAKIYDLYDLAAATDSTHGRLNDLVNDPEIDTPLPKFVNGSRIYWDVSDIDAFKELLKQAHEAEMAKTYTRGEIAERAVKRIKLESNVYATSKIAHRDAFNRAEAVYMFANNLGSTSVMDKETRVEMMDLIRDLKQKAGLK